ncbi:MAG: thiamine phosphate synthase, partial [Eggerthellaceae bacterium]|nr:thiamine phosphate synthase [Eggerthellaceae bacterium]
MRSPEELRASLRLYVVTDRRWLKGRNLASCVADALAGGATCVQLREKGRLNPALKAEARKIRRLCAKAQVPFIVNDHVEWVSELDADGVHIGQGDMDYLHARELLGPDKIIGVSVQNRSEAIIAAGLGADYLGAGAVFSTPSKPESADIGLAALKDICSAVSVPVVAIGGIDLATLPMLAHSGVAGVAVISAILAQ